MLDCIYTFVKDFQTLIVGVIGFTGVILTIKKNAAIANEQQAQNINHERATLRNALISELELIRDTFIKNSEVPEGDEQEDAFYPMESHTKVYQSFINKLGLLTNKEASSVITAYTLVDELPIRLNLLSPYEDRSFGRYGYIYIEAQYAEAARGIYASFATKLEDAINHLKRNICK